MDIGETSHVDVTIGRTAPISVAAWRMDDMWRVTDGDGIVYRARSKAAAVAVCALQYTHYSPDYTKIKLDIEDELMDGSTTTPEYGEDVLIMEYGTSYDGGTTWHENAIAIHVAWDIRFTDTSGQPKPGNNARDGLVGMIGAMWIRGELDNLPL